MISIIAAIGKNNELGKGNDLLWKLPADLKHFRDTTRGHTVIMGRKTFESLPNGALPNRKNIVITRDKNYIKNNIFVVSSLEEAIKNTNREEESFIIGGAEIYKQSIPFANKLYITKIDGEDPNADAYFPSIEENDWSQKSIEKHDADEKNPVKYAFLTFERKN